MGLCGYFFSLHHCLFFLLPVRSENQAEENSDVAAEHVLIG